MTKPTLITLSAITIATCLFTASIYAEAPALKTPSPVIYLADNLDEKDNLGWCIDTVGRGFAEDLHTHSCKPRGGDVQFSYNKDSLQIASATYENKCAVLKEEAKAGTKLGLVDCDVEASAQKFVYDTEAQTFHPEGEDALCLAAGDGSKSAGPFMSRALALVSCDETDATLKQWVIKDK